MCYHNNSAGLTETMTEKSLVKNSCHDLVYCKDTGYVKLKSLNNEEAECLKLRSGLWARGSSFYPIFLRRFGYLLFTTSYESDFSWSAATQMVESPRPLAKLPNSTSFYLITYIADEWYEPVENKKHEN